MAIKVADTFIAVGGDLSGYRKSLGDAKTEAMSLGKQLRQAFTDPASFGGRSKLAGLVSDLKLGRSVTASLKTAAQGLGQTLKGVTANALHASLNGVKNVLGGLKGALKEVAKGFGLGAGIASFQALGRVIGDIVGFIPDLVDKARDYAMTVRTIQIATGATVEESSRFAATLDYLGGRTTKLSNLFAQMSRNLDTATPQLNALGVTTHKTNGAILSQIEILENARHAFQLFGDGTAKADAIARAFGEEGLATFVEYLRLTDEQIRIIAKDAEESGQIISAAQIKAALITERESNRIEMALRGIGIALLTTVGPQISAFLSNLTKWVQENMAAISKAIGEVVSFILGLVGSLVGVTDGMASFTSSLLGSQKAVNPYNADLASLRSQLAQLGDENTNAAGSTDALRDSIQAQIKVVERQIEVLKRQEKAQDTVFRRAIAGLARVYQLRLDNLDLMERERQILADQHDLNEQLNEAVLDLSRAQRGKMVDGQRVIDAQDVSDAMARIADIQGRQAEAAHDLEVAGQRKSLENTRDYIESIGELLENAENKRAALNTLRRREDVLNARLQDQLASGDTAGAAETQARLEAIKTAQIRAQEMIRNENAERALDRRKEMLQEELSDISAAAVSVTAIRRAEIEKQIADLEKQAAAWDNMTGKQRKMIRELTDEVSGEGGLTAAMNEAREAGVEFGREVKEALKGLGDIFGGLLDFLTGIKDTLDEIGESDVWKFLTQPIGGSKKKVNNAGPGFGQTGDQGGPPNPGNEIVDWLQQAGRPSSDENAFDVNDINRLIAERRDDRLGNRRLPEFAEGGVVGGLRGSRQPIFAHAGEGIASLGLMDKLERFVSGSMMQTPAFATAGEGIIEQHIHLEIDGREVAEVVNRIQDRQYKR